MGDKRPLSKGFIMLKNALEPQCYKWWDFPLIPGRWVSVRSYPDGSHALLTMNKPKDPTQAGNVVTDFQMCSETLNFEQARERDFAVIEYEPGEGFSNEQLELLEKHFGVCF